VGNDVGQQTRAEAPVPVSRQMREIAAYYWKRFSPSRVVLAVIGSAVDITERPAHEREKGEEVMTWKEFKEEVDRQLAAQGKDENIDIWYIDISFPDDLTIGTKDPCGMSIGN
jgi:hypothetical protein